MVFIICVLPSLIHINSHFSCFLRNPLCVVVHFRQHVLTIRSEQIPALLDKKGAVVAQSLTIMLLEMFLQKL